MKYCSVELHSIDMNGLRHSAKYIVKATEKHILIPIFFSREYKYIDFGVVFYAADKILLANFFSVINNYNGNVIVYVCKD